MDLIKDIVEKIVPVLPNGWEKVYLRGVILPGSYEFEMYVSLNGQILQDRELFSPEEYRRGWHKIKRELRMISNDMLQKSESKWYGYILVFDKDYKFSVDYLYGDGSNTIDEHWIDRYK